MADILMPIEHELAALRDKVNHLEEQLSLLRSNGLERLLVERLEQHAHLSPGGIPYWLVRQAGGNAQFQTTKPTTAQWSDA